MSVSIVMFYCCKERTNGANWMILNTVQTQYCLVYKPVSVQRILALTLIIGNRNQYGERNHLAGDTDKRLSAIWILQRSGGAEGSHYS